MVQRRRETESTCSGDFREIIKFISSMGGRTSKKSLVLFDDAFIGLDYGNNQLGLPFNPSIGNWFHLGTTDIENHSVSFISQCKGQEKMLPLLRHYFYKDL